MRIPVCHHYWQDGQDARWQPAAFPVPEIEAAIKSDYLELQAKRPQWRKYGAFWAIFDYRPEKDVFGRPIVPISFAFLPDRPDAAHLLPQIKSRLAAAPRGCRYIEVQPPESGARRPHILAVFLICAVLAAGALLFLRSSPGTQGRQGEAMRQEEAAAGDLVCGNSGSLLTCPRIYLQERCANRTSLSFREFREREAVCRPVYGVPEPWSPNIAIFRERPEPETAAAIEKFLLGEDSGF